MIMDKKMKRLIENSNIGAFPHVSPYGDEHKSFYLDRYVEDKENTLSSGSSNVKCNNVGVYKTPWGNNSKKECTGITLFKILGYCSNNGLLKP